MLGALVMEHDGMVQMLGDMGAKNVQAMASLYAKRVVDGEHLNETYRSSPDGNVISKTKWLSSIREGHTI